MTIKKSSSSGIPSGLNAGRPANPGFGQLYSNGEAARLELYTQASGWQNIVQETPGVSSISGNYSEATDSGVITIYGTNFVSGCYATAIGTNGVQVDAGSTTFNSLVQVIATFTGLSNQYEPYDIKVTNPSNLFGMLPDALYVNASPVWVTASGSLGSFVEQVSITLSALSATDSDSATITYALASGSTLPSGVTLNSTTGVISGILPDIATDTTYSFTVNATDGLNVIPRTFSFVSYAAPIWSTASGSLGSIGYAAQQGYSYQLSATALSNTLSYSLQSGLLPTGFSLSSLGVISGSAAEVQSQTTSTFTVRVSDGTAFADRSFSITINPAVTLTYSTAATYSVSIPQGITEAEVTLLGAGGGGSSGDGAWAYGGGGGSYLKALYPVTPGSYSLVVGAEGPAKTTCNNNASGAFSKGGNTTFGNLVASGGSGGTQAGGDGYPGGGGLGIANITTGASVVLKNLIGGNGNGGGEGLSSGGSNGLKNIDNDSTYGQGAAGVANYTPGIHATGNGNGGGGGPSCQGGHRGGGNGSSGYAIIKY